MNMKFHQVLGKLKQSEPKNKFGVIGLIYGVSNIIIRPHCLVYYKITCYILTNIWHMRWHYEIGEEDAFQRA